MKIAAIAAVSTLGSVVGLAPVNTADILARFDPVIALVLIPIGMAFGAFVMWHLPTARQLGAIATTFMLGMSTVVPWTFILFLRWAEALPGWEQSIGTAAFFAFFVGGVGLGIRVRQAVEVRAVRRRLAAAKPRLSHAPFFGHKR